jgi:hypothetical protein
MPKSFFEPSDDILALEWTKIQNQAASEIRNIFQSKEASN